MKDDERLTMPPFDDDDVSLHFVDDFVKNFNNQFRLSSTISCLYIATLWLEELEILVTEEHNKQSLNRFIKTIKCNLKDWGINYEHFRS